MAKIDWEPWGRAAFDRAAADGKPVFLDLYARWSLMSRTLDEVYQDGTLSKMLNDRFVPVRVDCAYRPDIALRYACGKECTVVLSEKGELLSVPEFRTPGELEKALDDITKSFKVAEEAAEEKKDDPVWTGAVGPTTIGKIDPEWPGKVIGELKKMTSGTSCPDCLELLLYAAVDLKDDEARSTLFGFLIDLAQGPLVDKKAGGFAREGESKRLGLNSRLSRIYWDAYSLGGTEQFAETASKTHTFIIRELFDPGAGAFRTSSEVRGAFFTDSNAMAVLAMLKAAAYPGGERSLEYAKQTLAFLTKLYDTSQGMAHAWNGKPTVFGLLPDNAWMMMALTESFLVTGNKPHRDFADALLKYLFQELWDREKGGFFDRVPDPSDVAVLKKGIILPGANGVAFEGAWRLHEVKGNHNYRRWLEWGLKRMSGELTATCDAAPFARLQEMFSRGRMDLELVGRLQESRTKAFLWVLQRRYLPRKIVSFVDPDDQDYIMAHKLEAESYPRLFGCIDLRRKADVDDPEKVDELLKAFS